MYLLVFLAGAVGGTLGLMIFRYGTRSSERRRSKAVPEKTQMERTARLEALSDNVPGVPYEFRVGLDGGQSISFIGEGATELLGLNPETDGFYERFVQHIPKSHREEFLQSAEEAIMNRSHWRQQVPFDRPDGERVWLLGSAEPESKEEEVLFRGVLLDITDRVSEERRREQVIQRVTDAIVEVDAEWRFTLVNDQAESLYGMAERDLLGKDFWNVFSQAKGTRFEKKYREVMQSREPARLEERFERLNAWFDIQVYPNPGGGLAFYFDDITERREREEQLREREEMLRSITENVSDGIYRSTAEEGIVYANSAFTEMFGYRDLEELRAADGKVLYDDPARREELTEKGAKEGGLDREEVRYRRKDGTTFIGLLNAQRVGGGQGKTYFDGAITDVTKRIEERRRREQTIRRTTDGIVEVDSEWRITLVNDQAERIYGSDEEMLGKNLWKVFGEGKGTQFEEVYREVMRSREPAEIEEYFEGFGEWFDVQVYPNEDGGLALYSEKITERKRRKKELERQNDLFERAQEIANVGAWEYDVQAGEATWTEKAYRIAGHPLGGDTSPENTLKLYHPEDRPRVRSGLKRAIEEGEPFDIEVRIASVEEKRWVRAQGEPQWKGKPENGEIARVRGTIQDITEQKRREETIEKRRRKIEALYRATSGLFSIEGRDAVPDRILVVLEEVFDFPLAHIGLVEDGVLDPKKTVAGDLERIPDPQPQPVDADLVATRAIRAGEAVVVESVSGLENDLDYGTLSTLAGIPIGAHGAVVVGKEENGFEAFNLRLLEVLASYGSLALVRLEREERLVQAREEAEEAGQLKSAMLANMSHEVRTPLMSMIGSADLLREDLEEAGLEGEVAEMARQIFQSGQRLRETLDSVLQLSRLESGAYTLDDNPAYLDVIVREVAQELNLKAHEKGVRLEVESPATSVEARVDETAVRRIVTNLVENAIKFTPEDGEVQVRARPEDGETVLLEVEDTGVGIAEDARDTIFDGPC